MLIDSILGQYRIRHGTPHIVGLLLSPHLIRVRERISLNSTPISEEAFAKYFFEVWDRLGGYPDVAQTQDHELPSLRPPYSRFLTLMSWHVFIQERVDVAVQETGVGGELDATNLVQKPLATAITDIDIDHVHALGTTIPSIAWHKAGIMKKGSPAFTVEQLPEAAAVLKLRAAEKEVDLQVKGIDPRIEALDVRPNADYQKRNVSLAIAACDSVAKQLGWPVNKGGPLSQEFVDGIEKARFRGRSEIQKEDRVTWHIDGAHTNNSLVVATQWFQRETSGLKGPRVLVFNQQSRAEATGFLDSIINECKDSRPGSVQGSDAPIFDRVIFCTSYSKASEGSRAFVNRQVDEKAVKQMTQQTKFAERWEQLQPGAEIVLAHSVEEALGNARSLSQDLPQDQTVQVFVTGSLHLVGCVLAILEKEEYP